MNLCVLIILPNLTFQVQDLNHRLNAKTEEAEKLKRELTVTQVSAHENEERAQNLTLKVRIASFSDRLLFVRGKNSTSIVIPSTYS